MRTRDVVDLLLLSLLWGAAYLFMRSAVPAFGPAPLAFVRLSLATLMLTPLLLWRGGWPQLRAHPVALLVLGIPFTGIPFLLLAFASQHLTAGLVSVLNATSPLFAALVAHHLAKERLGRWRVLGLVVGLLGVVLLMWGGTAFKSNDGRLAVGAVLLGSVAWGFGSHHTRKRLGGVDAVAMTVGSLLAASLFLAPFALASWPQQTPPARAWMEVVFLGVASSGLGFLLYFRLLRRIGPVRAMSVTFLNPVVSVVAGALYLGEGVTLQMLGGGAVVLLGTALTLGIIGPGAVPAKAAAASS
jgi:drug/metabolite transporter (DMT)-like permease